MFPLTSNPRTVSEADFLTLRTPAKKLCFLLNYAVLAPSEYNTQPWLFKVSGRTTELYVDRSRRLPVIDPEDRELIISCGAALCNYRLALRHFGYVDEVQIDANQDHPDLLACISLGKKQAATQEDHQLFSAILQRRTNRHMFEQRKVAETLLSIFEDLAMQEGAWFHVVRAEEGRRMLTNMIALGDRMQWADKRFRQELAAWARSPEVLSHDGLPGYAQSKGTFASSISPFLVRTFDMGPDEEARDRQLADGAPVLAVIGTMEDTWRDWLAAGQAVEKVLLRACAAGVQGSFLNQPIEIASLRVALRNLIDRPGFPQIVLRLGYAPHTPATPRRSVSEVLL